MPVADEWQADHQTAHGPRAEAQRVALRAAAPGRRLYPPPASLRQLERLASLFHRRWSMQVLVEVHRFGKVRPSTVSHRLWRASRYGLNATLVDLVDHELVRRDAGGYFSLTSRGRHIARVGGRLLFQLRQLRVEDVALRKWSLPVILALSERGKRFNALRRCLPGTTARALAATLKNLQHAELVERIVFLTYAPQTYYYLRFRTKRLVPLLAQL